MGTPHRGSQLASYADIAVTCIKAAGVKANISNIHHLKLDSDILEEIGSQFGSLLQSEQIKVLTFYELKPTKIAGISEALVRLEFHAGAFFKLILPQGCSSLVSQTRHGPTFGNNRPSGCGSSSNSPVFWPTF
jgi:hypothetical protein